MILGIRLTRIGSQSSTWDVFDYQPIGEVGENHGIVAGVIFNRIQMDWNGWEFVRAVRFKDGYDPQKVIMKTSEDGGDVLARYVDCEFGLEVSECVLELLYPEFD